MMGKDQHDVSVKTKKNTNLGYLADQEGMSDSSVAVICPHAWQESIDRWPTLHQYNQHTVQKVVHTIQLFILWHFDGVHSKQTCSCSKPWAHHYNGLSWFLIVRSQKWVLDLEKSGRSELYIQTIKIGSFRMTGLLRSLSLPTLMIGPD